MGAALLVALLAGGAAGVGAAALLDSNTAADVANASNDTALNVQPSKDTPASSGSVEAAAAAALPSVVKIYASSPMASGSGSGIVLTKDGEILTNNHVVALAAESNGRIAVSFNDGTSAKATVVGRDPLTDLAVIKAEGVDNLTPAKLGDSGTLDVGEQVVALGAPFGLESTVTTGIVSALNRPVTTQGESASDPATIFPAIQTDAAINPGNSGGPLINTEGQVVGINSAIRTATNSMTGEQGGSIGLGFAIPISDAVPIVDQLRSGETPTHARIGVTVTDSSDRTGLPGGALVKQVDSDTAAASSGLEVGDVVKKIDDHEVADADTLVALVRTYRPGDEVTLTVMRNGDQHELKLTLGSDAG